MKAYFNPTGPYHIEIIFSEKTSAGGERLSSAVIDGFFSAKEAWAACHEMRGQHIIAIAANNSEIEIAPEDVLQIIVLQTAPKAPIRAVA